MAQPLKYAVLNLHHRTQPKSTSYSMGHSLYNIPSHKSAHICIHITQVGPCQLRSPLGSSHFQNGILHGVPVRTHKTPKRHGAHPCVQSHKNHAAKGSPFFHWNWLPKSTNSTSIYTVDMLWTHSHWGPLEDAPCWATGCSCFTFFCTVGLAAKQGPTVS